jgi:CelD/BcsL family acetyltransferase involved in cellulose biosynthesis
VTATVLQAARPATGLETIRSFEAAEAIAPEWDALVERLGGSLYMTFDWCRVWWRHYGAGRELRLMAVRDGGELAGLLPFFVERLGLRFGRARVAKVVGSDHTNVMVDPPVDPRLAASAWKSAVERLVVQDGCDLVHVGPISGQSAQLGALRGLPGLLRDRETGSHTVFEMPDGFDAYLGSLSKNQRSNYRRNVNKLGKAFDFQVDVLGDGAALEREFGAFAEMHQAQWKAAGNLGHFGDWPKSLEYNRDLVRTLAESGRVRLMRMLADGRVVSYYFSFELDGTWYWRLPARLVGEEWDRFALGRVGLLKMLEVAAAEGATAIEAGTGRYEYKEKLNARSIPVHSVTVGGRGLAARCRARLAIAVADLLDLAYYRLWFARVAPRLGIPLRPLWRSWIRSRF